MELEINEAFPTLIGRLRIPDAEAMNRDLQALILADESKYPTLGRSNIGGWHSAPDFLRRDAPCVAGLTTWLSWSMSRMVEASAGRGAAQGIPMLLSGWATVCRSGAYHAPHSHPDSAWSGVYYVDAGSKSTAALSGVLEFLDPRAAVEAITAPGDPYGEPVRVYPESGLLVIFPSWLFHWVHPYTGETPRIAVSFNAAIDRLRD